ncbi:hypothetical protein LOC68_26630 [Blastopirellula sp. JC732]|uniref:Uncharacterized protein n=1 Tax=Blastopirellula sediminis TaxID=2894196 RepID=A0A9X1MRE3_9BACT|nr:hypothetical protein [Blastopirellula sediminis]MCC9604713.1 hypothetical protein [Blastopirellula sediminis]MCC9631988.1 hypothetical protein [Blastopirellula sediminis]
MIRFPFALAVFLAACMTAQLSAADAHQGFYEIHLELSGTSPTSERPENLAMPAMHAKANVPFSIDAGGILPRDPQFDGPPLETGMRLAGILRPNANGQLQLQATLRRSEEVENDAGVTIVRHDSVDVRMTLQGAELDPQLAAIQPPKGRMIKLSETRSLIIRVRPVSRDATAGQPIAIPSTAPLPVN